MLAVICMNNGLKTAYLGTGLEHMHEKLFLSVTDYSDKNIWQFLLSFYSVLGGNIDWKLKVPWNPFWETLV